MSDPSDGPVELIGKCRVPYDRIRFHEGMVAGSIAAMRTGHSYCRLRDPSPQAIGARMGEEPQCAAATATSKVLSSSRSSAAAQTVADSALTQKDKSEEHETEVRGRSWQPRTSVSPSLPSTLRI